MIPRFQLPRAALAVFYRVDHSTVTRAVHETRPLLAARVRGPRRGRTASVHTGRCLRPRHRERC
ncbi:hypothetical protein ABZV61_09060 [Streptomyces sp900116325]|uniref:Transposase Helix-turn-helix domain-containing protein n=1 Tax=Streptomyces sp. 900116325 TaxID=3154295 RepID=A0ABV2U839_9ACTN